jgi:hypothetical protein
MKKREKIIDYFLVPSHFIITIPSLKGQERDERRTNKGLQEKVESNMFYLMLMPKIQADFFMRRRKTKVMCSVSPLKRNAAHSKVVSPAREACATRKSAGITPSVK